MSHVTSVFCLSAALALACSSLGAQRILATTFGTLNAESLGSMIATLGDLDGDGVPDYALGASLASTPTIYLCSGRTTGVLRTLTGPPNEDWGTSVADIGDVNADGVPDLAVGAPLRRNSPGTGAIRPVLRARRQPDRHRARTRSHQQLSRQASARHG